MTSTRERGTDVVGIPEGNWFYLWDGTPHGWLLSDRTIANLP